MSQILSVCARDRKVVGKAKMREKTKSERKVRITEGLKGM